MPEKTEFALCRVSTRRIPPGFLLRQKSLPDFFGQWVFALCREITWREPTDHRKSKIFDAGKNSIRTM